jgi:ADP-ribosylglycohydrolase
MYGAILGDILGSIYEFNNLKTENPDTIDLFNPECYFTDDTVLTVAVADAILKDGDYEEPLFTWAGTFPDAGYGKKFADWARNSKRQPYNSWGNGSAMRVSSVGWAFDTLEETLAQAKKSAEITHNHPEGIKGAQATAGAIFMARTGSSKQDIKEYIEKTFGYNLHRTVKEIRPDYHFDVSCQGTVPEAITAFLESRDFAHAMQLAISLGGDTDTLACIIGGIAEAFYRIIPQELIDFANARLPKEMKFIIAKFYERYNIALSTVDNRDEIRKIIKDSIATLPQNELEILVKHYTKGDNIREFRRGGDKDGV